MIDHHAHHAHHASGSCVESTPALLAVVFSSLLAGTSQADQACRRISDLCLGLVSILVLLFIGESSSGDGEWDRRDGRRWKKHSTGRLEINGKEARRNSKLQKSKREETSNSSSRGAPLDLSLPYLPRPRVEFLSPLFPLLKAPPLDQRPATSKPSQQWDGRQLRLELQAATGPQARQVRR